MVAFLGFYAAAELSHFVEIVPRVPVSAVKWKKFGKMGFRTWSIPFQFREFGRMDRKLYVFSNLLVQVPARCAASEQCVCCGDVGACS